MNVPLFLIVILATTLNISSFFTLAAKAPQYTMFTGAVHYPTDYQYYLSFITQGAYHWIRSYHVLTGETTTLGYLNWIYVFCGHIGSLFHLNAPIIYQCMVILGSVAYLIIAYKLIGVSTCYSFFLMPSQISIQKTEHGYLAISIHLIIWATHYFVLSMFPTIYSFRVLSWLHFM